MQHTSPHTSPPPAILGLRRLPPSLLLPSLLLTIVSTAAADDLNQQFKDTMRPLLAKYCTECHSDDYAEGDVNFESFATAAEVRDHRDQWLKVEGQLQANSMPPDDAEQPTKEERALLLEWIDQTIHKVDCSGPVDPGHVTLRRLNRLEYRLTVRDLLGIDYGPADDFPADDVGYGFDNIGDVLSLPPLLMEKYLPAAQQISEEAIITPRSRCWIEDSCERSERHGQVREVHQLARWPHRVKRSSNWSFPPTANIAYGCKRRATKRVTSR